MDMEAFVLDCSMAIAWCFEDEVTSRTDEIHESLSTGAKALVPSLWHLEISNVFINAERRKRISKSDTARFIELLSKLPIITDEETPMRSFNEILTLAREYTLSSYDAAYLELAVRKGLPLATNDQPLQSAAKSCGISCL